MDLNTSTDEQNLLKDFLFWLSQKGRKATAGELQDGDFVLALIKNGPCKAILGRYIINENSLGDHFLLGEVVEKDMDLYFMEAQYESAPTDFDKTKSFTIDHLEAIFADIHLSGFSLLDTDRFFKNDAAIIYGYKYGLRFIDIQDPDFGYYSDYATSWYHKVLKPFENRVS